ncbi:MAG: carboxymuconolactone decarboxylase family protein [Rhizobiales bacterium]|nr:carboxymuconolactone decarboxylase family protein [Hyphomicrobiales bacterium]
MSTTPPFDPADMSPQAVMARAAAARGDMFPEWQIVADALPQTVAMVTRTGGYLHKYEGQSSDDQQLSVQMRELIATPAICAKGDLRHSPNHIRRMYRMGMTNRIILEAATTFGMVVGWANMLNVAFAISEALSPDYPFGELPQAGAPAELTPFPELELGRVRVAGTAERLSDKPEWAFGATIDPELVRRVEAWADHCLPGQASGECLLGNGPRELIVIAALATRGETARAAGHIRNAYDWGMTPRQVLEAISATMPMTGMITVEIGLAAMELAGQP